MCVLCEEDPSTPNQAWSLAHCPLHLLFLHITVVKPVITPWEVLGSCCSTEWVNKQT